MYFLGYHVRQLVKHAILSFYVIVSLVRFFTHHSSQLTNLECEIKYFANIFHSHATPNSAMQCTGILSLTCTI